MDSLLEEMRMTAAGSRDPNDKPARSADASGRKAASDSDSRAPEPPPQAMIPARGRRRTKVERVSMRVLATGGIIGIAVAMGAILGAQNIEGWIIGLTVGLTSVILAAVLWSSRQL